VLCWEVRLNTLFSFNEEFYAVEFGAKVEAAMELDAERVRRKRPVEALDRERIIGRALALVDGEGLDGLSMRRLGAELGVDPMALYHYVPNKEALLDAIVEAVMAEMRWMDDRRISAEERLVRLSTAYRDVMLAHGNALPLLLSRGPVTPAALRPIEAMIGILRDAGLSPAEALAGMNLVTGAVRGIVGMMAPAAALPPIKAEEAAQVLSQLRREEFPNLLEAAPFAGFFRDMGFEYGIRSIARGLMGSRRPAHRRVH